MKQGSMAGEAYPPVGPCFGLLSDAARLPNKGCLHLTYILIQKAAVQDQFSKWCVAAEELAVQPMFCRCVLRLRDGDLVV